MSGRYRKPAAVAAAAFALMLVVLVAVLGIGGGDEPATGSAVAKGAARTTQTQIAKLEAAARQRPTTPTAS